MPRQRGALMLTVEEMPGIEGLLRAWLAFHGGACRCRHCLEAVRLAGRIAEKRTA